jgi:uncharacterized protein (UPF0210 family)
VTTRIHSRLALIFALVFASFAQAAGKPPVRAITAFVELQPARYEQQIAEVAGKLGQTRRLFEQAGFEVQTVRITTQPYSNYVRGLTKEQALALLFRLEELAAKHSVLLNIGPAVLDDQPDPLMLELLEEVHSRVKQLDASMIVASEKGVHWNAVHAAARHIKRVAEKSPRSQGTFNFAATAMLGPGAPFYPGSWHANQGGRFSVGLQGANVVAGVFASSRGDALAATRQLGEALSALANDVHRISRAAEAATGWKYWGFDSTPAPLKDDSIGAAMESLYASHFGAAGTMTAAYVITQAQQQIPEPRIGYGGLMIPVLEDSLLARRWSEGAINIDSLLAYSAVCGTGLDTVPLPGDVTEEQLVRILGDMAVLAFKWKKPLTARLQPVHGAKAGEMSAFDDPFLVNAKLQPLR